MSFEKAYFSEIFSESEIFPIGNLDKLKFCFISCFINIILSVNKTCLLTYKKQRSEKSSQLMQHLSKYTGRKIDQRPEVIVENSDPIIIQGPPTYIASRSSGGSSGGGSGSNWELDMLELRA